MKERISDDQIQEIVDAYIDYAQDESAMIVTQRLVDAMFDIMTADEIRSCQLSK